MMTRHWNVVFTVPTVNQAGQVVAQLQVNEVIENATLIGAYDAALQKVKQYSKAFKVTVTLQALGEVIKIA